jgi:hypothetical protein
MQFRDFHTELTRAAAKIGDGGWGGKKFSKTGNLASLDIHVDTVLIY